MTWVFSASTSADSETGPSSVVLAASGLLASFGLQAFVNMASSLRLIPTKGMTLPFVSYGGSSVVAIAAGIGMLLAITRTRSRAERGWDAVP